MLIGILSDTHNNLEITQKAVKVFKDNSVDMIIHAGDLTSPKIMELFTDFDCRFVLGNADIDSEVLNEKSCELGYGCVDEYCTIEIDSKKILVFHGNDVPFFRQSVASGSYDYIIKGHTHFFENYVSNETRIINPGSLYGSDEFSVAILDTETDKVDMIRIPKED